MNQGKDFGRFEEIKSIFTNYIESRGSRKTQGRYDILREIYSLDEHFDVDTLYITLKNKNYHISRATIYNTIELLLDCGLIVKHSFGYKAGTYEKSYGGKQHDHLIRLDTQEVIEFEDERLKDIAQSIGDKYNYDVTHYSFTIYGKPKKS